MRNHSQPLTHVCDEPKPSRASVGNSDSIYQPVAESTSAFTSDASRHESTDTISSGGPRYSQPLPGTTRSTNSQPPNAASTSSNQIPADAEIIDLDTLLLKTGHLSLLPPSSPSQQPPSDLTELEASAIAILASNFGGRDASPRPPASKTEGNVAPREGISFPIPPIDTQFLVDIDVAIHNRCDRRLGAKLFCAFVQDCHKLHEIRKRKQKRNGAPLPTVIPSIENESPDESFEEDEVKGAIEARLEYIHNRRRCEKACHGNELSIIEAHPNDAVWQLVESRLGPNSKTRKREKVCNRCSISLMARSRYWCHGYKLPEYHHDEEREQTIPLEEEAADEQENQTEGAAPYNANFYATTAPRKESRIKPHKPWAEHEDHQHITLEHALPLIKEKYKVKVPAFKANISSNLCSPAPSDQLTSSGSKPKGEDKASEDDNNAASQGSPSPSPKQTKGSGSKSKKKAPNNNSNNKNNRNRAHPPSPSKQANGSRSKNMEKEKAVGNDNETQAPLPPPSDHLNGSKSKDARHNKANGNDIHNDGTQDRPLPYSLPSQIPSVLPMRHPPCPSEHFEEAFARLSRMSPQECEEYRAKRMAAEAFDGNGEDQEQSSSRGARENYPRLTLTDAEINSRAEGKSIIEAAGLLEAAASSTKSNAGTGRGSEGNRVTKSGSGSPESGEWFPGSPPSNLGSAPTTSTSDSPSSGPGSASAAGSDTDSPAAQGKRKISDSSHPSMDSISSKKRKTSTASGRSGSESGSGTPATGRRSSVSDVAAPAPAPAYPTPPLTPATPRAHRLITFLNPAANLDHKNHATYLATKKKKAEEREAKEREAKERKTKEKARRENGHLDDEEGRRLRRQAKMPVRREEDDNEEDRDEGEDEVEKYWRGEGRWFD